MPVLAAPDTITGQLRAEDLDAAREHSTSTIWQPRECPPCTGDCANGRQCPKRAQSFPSAGWQHTVPVLQDACAPEGGKHAEPVPTKTRRDVVGARVGAVLLLISAVIVIGVIGGAIWARWPLF